LTHRNITIVTRRQAALTIQLPVGNRYRQYRPPGRQRRLNQRCMKMQQASAIGGGAFGENSHMLPFVENPGNLLVDHLGVAATTSP